MVVQNQVLKRQRKWISTPRHLLYINVETWQISPLILILGIFMKIEANRV